MELLVILLGTLTSLIMGALKKYTTWINSIHPTWRAVIVGVLAVPIALLAGVLGLNLPADPAMWDGNVINSILTALLAMGQHALLKAIRNK